MTVELRFTLDAPWPTPWHRAGVVGLAVAVDTYGREWAQRRDWSFVIQDRALVVSAAQEGVCWEGLEAVRLDAYTADHLGIVRLPQARGGPTGARLFAHEAYLDVFSMQGATAAGLAADKAASATGLSKDDKSQVAFLVDTEPRLLNLRAQRYGRHGAPGRPLKGGLAGLDLKQWLVPGCAGGGDEEASLAHGSVFEEVMLAFAPCGLLFIAFQPMELHGKQTNLRRAALLPEWSATTTLRQAVDIVRRWSIEPGRVLPGGRRLGSLGLAQAMLTLDDVNALVGVRLIESGKSLVSDYKVPRGSSSLGSIPQNTLRRLREAYALFPSVSENSWETVRQPSICLGLIADNAVAGRPLYDRFATLCASADLFERIHRENRGRLGLRRIVMTRPEEAGIGRLEEDLLAILDACTKATLKRATKGKPDPSSAMNAAREKLRVTFHAARSHSAVRFAVVDLMSRAYLPEELRTALDWDARRAALFKLLDSPQEWMKVRDLCLFALASYAGQGKTEAPEATDAENSPKESMS